MRSPRFGSVGEAAGHRQSLPFVATAGKVAGAVIHDAKAAAICVDLGIRELWFADPADRYFGGFPRLKVVNPLVRR